jgi:hypothetical protein
LPKVKRPERDFDQSPPSSAEVKNTRSYTSTSHTWYSIKHRDILPVDPDRPSWGGRVTANKRGDVVKVPALIGQHLCLVPSAQGSGRREGKGPLGRNIVPLMDTKFCCQALKEGGHWEDISVDGRV